MTAETTEVWGLSPDGLFPAKICPQCHKPMICLGSYTDLENPSKSMEFKFEGWWECEVCDHTEPFVFTECPTCPDCKGSGKPSDYASFEYGAQWCDTCGGAGRLLPEALS